MIESLGDFVKVIGTIAALIFGIVSCNQSEWYQSLQRAQEAANKADEQPHVIRSTPDGCKVYAFKASGSWHYFTRCQATTTTERNYTETCGKNCTRNKQEIIVTQNK